MTFSVSSDKDLPNDKFFISKFYISFFRQIMYRFFYNLSIPTHGRLELSNVINWNWYTSR